LPFWQLNELQKFPQVPQFEKSVWRSTHEPKQEVSPAGQTHLPPWQSNDEQKFPQVPQLLVSVWRSTQVPKQSVRPLAQGAHLPFWQMRELQKLLQVPQFWKSDCRSTQPKPPLQEVVPEGQHWAPTQPPEAQVAPQAPQLFGSLEVSVHWLLQMVTWTNGTPGHVWQLPNVQVLTESQTLLHFPQFLRSVLGSMQVIWQISPLQPASGAWHLPAWQV
jgi:hypothetical protein